MHLETKRCLIRPLSLDDAEALHLCLSDPEVMRHIEPPFTLDKTRGFLRTAGLSSPPLVHALLWKATDDLIGHVIFHPYPGSEDWEMGWVIRRDYWGRGIASEISAALVEFARQHGIPGLIIECDPQQEASLHIAEKLGFQPIGEENGCVVFKLWLQK